MRALIRKWALLAAAVAALWCGGYYAGHAHASYQPTATDPAWTFDTLEIEKQVANFAKANGITTQAGWTTFINALTSGQSTAVSQGLLRAVKCSVP
jgi:hypothetical protein